VVIEEDKSFQGLTFSIVVHILIIVLLMFLPKPEIVVKERPTEITILDQGTSKNQKSFVADVSIPDKLLMDDLKKNAHYLSKVTRRVKEETRARHLGKTQNQPMEIPTLQPQQPSNLGQHSAGNAKPGGKSAPQEIVSSLKGLQPKPHQANGSRGSEEGLGRSLVLGPSSLGEHIPGVKDGSFTALNTDQFTYYTFFQRINEQLRPRWVNFVKNFIDTQSPTHLAQLARFELITQVEIVLSPDGQYQKGFIHRSSGDHTLDMTSIDAFQGATPFLNPPRGLVEDDGFIHLHYALVVELQQSAGI
jgi:protein TonB